VHSSTHIEAQKATRLQVAYLALIIMVATGKGLVCEEASRCSVCGQWIKDSGGAHICPGK